MSPLSRRFTCSIAVCPLDTSTNDCVVAVRPVVAAEAAPGEPDDATGDDEQAQPDHGDDRELAEPTMLSVQRSGDPDPIRDGSTHARRGYE